MFSDASGAGFSSLAFNVAQVKVEHQKGSSQMLERLGRELKIRLRLAAALCGKPVAYRTSQIHLHSREAEPRE